MGHSSKFVFPLPGRKSKPPPPTVSAPLTTKAQKILGAADLNLDVRAIPGWETQSNSGISIAVTESTNTAGEQGSSAAHNDDGGAQRALRDRRWEQESDIIPSALNNHSEALGSMVSDEATDASSLRRRQSNSTIRSYYDKSTLPLSISQQTSNSAMAKGLPSKAMALLDMDGGDFAEPRKARKKPSKLDLSAILQRSRAPRHLNVDGNNGLVLGADLLTKSPSVISSSTVAPTPTLPDQKQADPALRKRLTKESLRGISAHQTPAYESMKSPEQPSKASIELHNLYDHYEQRTFADAMDQGLHGCDYRVEPPSAVPSPAFTSSTTGQSSKVFLSPFPTTGLRPTQPASKPSPVTAADLKLAGVGAPSSPVPADCASVSSRHTRTSKASKRTEHSLQEIDLLQNSVLALSSDSEDDYEFSPKESLMVPPFSDGQASPTSPRSPSSQVSAGACEGSQGKTVKQVNLVPSPQSLPGGGHSSTATKSPPKIGPRTSSLNSRASSSTSNQALVRETSRLSIGTNSTDRTLSNVRNQRAQSITGPKKESKKMQTESQFDFPAPPSNRGSRSASVSRMSDPSYPPSLNSDDLYRYAVGADNMSIRSGTSLGSTSNTGRRSSAASSIHEGSGGRFMAVTRQEEMLLAALRMKRARMREDIIAEFESGMERDEHHHELRRDTTRDSFSSGSSMTRQSSRCTMRQDMGTLSARPRHSSDAELRGEHLAGGDLLGVAIPQSPFDPVVRTPASEISGLILSEESRSSHSLVGLERKDSRASSVNSQRSGSSRRRSSLGAATASASRRSQRRDGSTSRQNSRQPSPNGRKDLPHQIPEDPAEDDDDADDDGIPRPDSPVSPSDFPVPVSIRNKQQVRLSAVGFYKPSHDGGW